MPNQNLKYGFWIWSNKLNPVLSMLSQIINYDLSNIERELILKGLDGTNDEKDIWYEFLIEGKQYQIDLHLAYDAEEGKDMIHLSLETSISLLEKLETLNLFQSMFKELKG